MGTHGRSFHERFSGTLVVNRFSGITAASKFSHVRKYYYHRFSTNFRREEICTKINRAVYWGISVTGNLRDQEISLRSSKIANLACFSCGVVVVKVYGYISCTVRKFETEVSQTILMEGKRERLEKSHFWNIRLVWLVWPWNSAEPTRRQLETGPDNQVGRVNSGG